MNTRTKAEIILACDTSTRHCAVSLCRVADKEGVLDVLADFCVERHKLHAERLLDSVYQILEAASCALEEVTCLAVASGPGSFTGLRVGLATWKGLAFALRLRLVAVPTLDAMARLFPIPDGLVVPLLDARMKEVFGAIYRFTDGVREKVIPERVCPVRDLLACDYAKEKPLVLLGDGVQRYEPEILALVPHAYLAPPECGTPRADTVAAEAYAMLRSGACVTDPALAAPCYLRASQAEQAREARLEAAAASPARQA